MQTICMYEQCFKNYLYMILNGKNKFIKHYDEDINKGYIFEVDVEYPKDLNNLHSDLPFLSKRMKIKNYNKLVWNLYDKKEYVAHIRDLKRALNNGLILKKVHRVIQFNQ